MLILKRQPGQSVTIETSDGPVRVCFVKVLSGRVSVGIDAPTRCRIVRSEIEKTSQEEPAQKEAGGT